MRLGHQPVRLAQILEIQEGQKPLIIQRLDEIGTLSRLPHPRYILFRDAAEVAIVAPQNERFEQPDYYGCDRLGTRAGIVVVEDLQSVPIVFLGFLERIDIQALVARHGEISERLIDARGLRKMMRKRLGDLNQSIAAASLPFLGDPEMQRGALTA